MSLFNDKVCRTYGAPPTLFLVEGDWSGLRQMGLGYANHPQVIVPKADLLNAPDVGEWLADRTLSDLGERRLQALFEQVGAQLQMEPDLGADWVAALRQGNAVGEGAYDGTERLRFWVVQQLQAAARGDIQDP